MKIETVSRWNEYHQNENTKVPYYLLFYSYPQTAGRKCMGFVDGEFVSIQDIR
ncbi:hypothetical protein CHISP_2111 [Chitinispirillum alkaliphilum]|nr:hypothetical protein CHISP_2111 [Chitinispirillum alkaliphilum]